VLDLTPPLRLLASRRHKRILKLDAVHAQERTLFSLLKRAQATKCGRDHDFASITTVADFQARVPLRNYEAMWNEDCAIKGVGPGQLTSAKVGNLPTRFAAQVRRFSTGSDHGMPQTIRYQLDEHCPAALAKALRRRGIDVTTTPDAGLIEATDDEQVEFALREGRAIFTQDEDFLAIHAKGVRHAGIVYCHPESRSLRQIIRGLVLIWDVYESDEMIGRLEYL
jgi:predicted nuclease of predicted toxin-antitoxin system